MAKVGPEVVDQLQLQAVISVSADVSFTSNKFPKYKLGPDNQILDEATVDSKGPPLIEVIAQETEQLSEQHKRLSVRDLATNFDKNLQLSCTMRYDVKPYAEVSVLAHLCEWVNLSCFKLKRGQDQNNDW
ncbi:hypothetical protein CTI12_AA439930 [Artemisia annua]|uniref:Stomatal closure-related actin-binding protein actin-binding domain-containing protein n=1 Tax=Artemisia annua TaxID=35608 RepID=A0A2U1LYA3_ARTAN|nr:hypothetical protein CTI12_AA439930 [Artemisia annua]